MVIIVIDYSAGLRLMSAPWQSLVIVAVLGPGIGLAYSSPPALIVDAVPASETGAANGLNTLMRSIGAAISSAVIGMVLARERCGRVAVPTMHGFRLSFLIATGAVAIGLLIALFLPRARPHHHIRGQLPDRPKQTSPGEHRVGVVGAYPMATFVSGSRSSGWSCIPTRLD
ncbi:MFS transporter [Nocardia sp. NPDC004604]|uniref:MFS transporter n=1 Tax=Nocardia sp. NPDC004604 TaxID=3157013 RepID=UPI0033B42396